MPSIADLAFSISCRAAMYSSVSGSLASICSTVRLVEMHCPMNILMTTCSGILSSSSTEKQTGSIMGSVMAPRVSVDSRGVVGGALRCVGGFPEVMRLFIMLAGGGKEGGRGAILQAGEAVKNRGGGSIWG